MADLRILFMHLASIHKLALAVLIGLSWISALIAAAGWADASFFSWAMTRVVIAGASVIALAVWDGKYGAGRG